MPPSRRWLLDHLWPPQDELTDLAKTDPVEVYRWARSRGWAASEAGNLAAYVIGLPLSFGESGMKPWTLKCVLALKFLRHLYVQGEWSRTPIQPSPRGSTRATGRRPTRDPRPARPAAD